MECAVWRWLPHRLLKFQLLYTIVLFRTTHSPGRSYSTYMYLYMYMYCLDKYLYTSLFLFLFWFCKYASSINMCLTTACLDQRCSSYCRSYQLHEPPCCQGPFLLSPWSKRWGRVGKEPGNEVGAGSAHFCKIYRKSSTKPPVSNKQPPSNKTPQEG